MCGGFTRYVCWKAFLLVSLSVSVLPLAEDVWYFLVSFLTQCWVIINRCHIFMPWYLHNIYRSPPHCFLLTSGRDKIFSGTDWLMSHLQLSFIFFMRLESFLSCTFLPVSKARTNKLCILRQCKYIKEKKLIPIFLTLHRFQWKIGIYFYRIK